MTVSEFPSLASLPFLPYIDAEGVLPDSLQGQVGVFGIFDQSQTLQFIGYSRDIFLTLQQLLVRRPHACYWLKVQTSDRPNRTMLETIREAWMAENGSVPPWKWH
ncbi:GIY-YIG nuclease family protein [Neosynechococcus sphagnicola]|uniref:GIY-YIG nuclease family protein n=1 Tax=Neosynechococcus sphagnicola TaxID=1501145 RepID=UPI001EF9CB98|nr:GIY-YIG nuclease family protein [Neosynechococcus sphagnicola]